MLSLVWLYLHSRTEVRRHTTNHLFHTALEGAHLHNCNNNYHSLRVRVLAASTSPTTSRRSTPRTSSYSCFHHLQMKRMADLPVRPWHTLLARSLLRSALATPFVSCTVGGNEGNDRWHGNNAVHDIPLSHGSSTEPDALQPDANGRSDALTAPLLDLLTVEGLL